MPATLFCTDFILELQVAITIIYITSINVLSTPLLNLTIVIYIINDKGSFRENILPTMAAWQQIMKSYWDFPFLPV